METALDAATVAKSAAQHLSHTLGGDVRVLELQDKAVLHLEGQRLAVFYGPIYNNHSAKVENIYRTLGVIA